MMQSRHLSCGGEMRFCTGSFSFCTHTHSFSVATLSQPWAHTHGCHTQTPCLGQSHPACRMPSRFDRLEIWQAASCGSTPRNREASCADRTHQPSLLYDTIITSQCCPLARNGGLELSVLHKGLGKKGVASSRAPSCMEPARRHWFRSRQLTRRCEGSSFIPAIRSSSLHHHRHSQVSENCANPTGWL